LFQIATPGSLIPIRNFAFAKIHQTKHSKDDSTKREQSVTESEAKAAQMPRLGESSD